MHSNFRGRADFMTSQWRHEVQWYSFWYQWIKEVHTYTLVVNMGVSGVLYRKSREGLQQPPPFGGRVTKNTSGGRGFKNDQKKLVAFEMHCCRKVLNIKWTNKVCNEDVLLRISSCKFKPKRILARIIESQLSWFGHVCRMSNMRLPKRTLMEMVPGTNRQGRPRKRWEDDIIAGSTFLEAYRYAGDRNRWADFVYEANVLWDTVQREIDRYILVG